MEERNAILDPAKRIEIAEKLKISVDTDLRDQLVANGQEFGLTEQEARQRAQEILADPDHYEEDLRGVIASNIRPILDPLDRTVQGPTKKVDIGRPKPSK